MDIVKGAVGLVGTVVVAGWVAFAISAPRNADNYMNQDMDALDGKSINQTMADAKAESMSIHCEKYRQLAQEQWDRSIANGTMDRDEAKMAELDRQVERFCAS